MANNKKFRVKNGLISPDAEFTGVTSITLPAGTSAERPSNPTIGMVRFNTELETLENYDGSEWTEVGGSVDITLLATASQGILATTAIQPGDSLLRLDSAAGFVKYNNTNSGLNSTDVQSALDELAALVQSLS